MLSASQRRGSSKRVVIIILAIVGGLGLLTVAACAGCGIWAYKSFTKDIPPAQASAAAFLDDIKSGNTDAAYASTSSSFKLAQNQQDFREFVNRLDTLKTHTSRSFDNSMIHQGTGGKKAVLRMTLRASNNAMACTITMVEENGVWKVERLSVP